MRQRYAYGSNIAAVRCGWEDRIMGNSRLRDCNLQSGAVLWLRHGFAHAFSGDSLPVDCFAYARNDDSKRPTPQQQSRNDTSDDAPTEATRA